MIIVTLVATLASAMVWQQWRAVQVESAERARAQAGWILSGALEFAKLILRSDANSASGRQFTGLTEPWATPLAESRLSTFLAVDKSNADDGPEAFLSGSIGDAQGRYNLRNLVVSSNTAPASVAPLELATLERLCTIVGVETGIADRIATGLLAAVTVPTGAAPLQPATVAQLVWLGIDATAVQTLQPYVVLLPTPTPLNVNTASKEVLAAVMNTDPASAERLVQIGARTPFKDVLTFKKQSASPAAAAASAQPNIDVRSNFFEVRARLRLQDRVLVERSLVNRTDPQQIVVLQRERVAGLDQPGG